MSKPIERSLGKTVELTLSRFSVTSPDVRFLRLINFKRESAGTTDKTEAKTGTKLNPTAVYADKKHVL